VESDDLHQHAIARAEEKLPPDDLDLATRYNDYGELLRYRGRLGEAEKYLDKAFDIAAKKPIRDAGKLAEIRSNRGVLLAEQDKRGEAKEVLKQTLAESMKAFGDQNAIVAADRYKLARVLIVLKEWSDKDGEIGAETLLKLSEAVLRPSGNLRTAKCFEAFAELRLAQGQPEPAARYALEVLEIRQKILPGPHPEIIHTLMQLARIEKARGQDAAAAKYDQQAQEMTASLTARENAAEAKLAGK
jgi:tetratricopeptide (TPR) repeat protein